jgi:molybdopterin biosynthesis enzyme MoaB
LCRKFAQSILLSRGSDPQEEEMKSRSEGLYAALTTAGAVILLTTSSFAQTAHYLITNEDNSQGNSATFYTVNSDGSLTQAAIVSTGGTGLTARVRWRPDA